MITPALSDRPEENTSDAGLQDRRTMHDGYVWNNVEEKGGDLRRKV